MVAWRVVVVVVEVENGGRMGRGEVSRGQIGRSAILFTWAASSLPRRLLARAIMRFAGVVRRRRESHTCHAQSTDQPLFLELSQCPFALH